MTTTFHGVYENGVFRSTRKYAREGLLLRSSPAHSPASFAGRAMRPRRRTASISSAGSGRLNR